MARSASTRSAPADPVANDDHQLAFPVHRLADGWYLDLVARPDQRLGELGEQCRVLGKITSHLKDVGAIVESHTDDLAGFGINVASDLGSNGSAGPVAWAARVVQSGRVSSAPTSATPVI